jgi:hypothetical protein
VPDGTAILLLFLLLETIIVFLFQLLLYLLLQAPNNKQAKLLRFSVLTQLSMESGLAETGMSTKVVVAI